MGYTKLYRNIKNGRHLIFFESIDADTTGLGGTWEGAGTFAEIFEVGKFYVLQNVGNSKPFAVLSSLEEIDKFLNGLLSNGIENKTTKQFNRADTEAAPVRLISLSGEHF
jgi:hypothetical protein